MTRKEAQSKKHLHPGHTHMNPSFSSCLTPLFFILRKHASIGKWEIVTFCPAEIRWVSCPSIVKIVSCELFIWTSSTGRTRKGNLLIGARGLSMILRRLSCITGPPIENECPVDPVAVEIMIPSIFSSILSPIIVTDIKGVLVRFTLVNKMSFKAGDVLIPSMEA